MSKRISFSGNITKFVTINFPSEDFYRYNLKVNFLSLFMATLPVMDVKKKIAVKRLEQKF